MTCPEPNSDACTDMSACPPCPRVAISGTEWAYSRDLGWHEPANEGAQH